MSLPKWSAISITLVLSEAIVLAPPAAATSPFQHWFHTYIASFGSGANEAHGVALDSSDNRIAVGAFSFDVDFGGGEIANAGWRDMFILKLTPNGDHVWSMGIGEEFDDAAFAVAVTADDDIVVAGATSNLTTYGGVPVPGQGNLDLVVMKLDTDGNQLWSRTIDGAGSEVPRSMALDSAGNIFIGGAFVGSPEFFGGEVVASSGTDGFLVKLDPDGEYVWSRVISSGPGYDDTHAVIIDSMDNLILAGTFKGVLELGAEEFESVDQDVYLAKFSNDGDHVWSQAFGGPDRESAHGLTVDAMDRIYLVGDAGTDVDFGGGVVPEKGGYLARFAPDGSYDWSTQYVDAHIRRVTVDWVGNIFFTGFQRVAVDFGGGRAGNEDDVCIVKLNPAGEYVWLKTYSGTWGYNSEGMSMGRGIVADGSGRLVAVGRFGSTQGAGFVCSLVDNPAVPVLVDGIETVWRDNHVEMSWRVSGQLDEVRAEVFRTESGGVAMARLVPTRDHDRGAFHLIDDDVRPGVTYRYVVNMYEGTFLATSFQSAIETPNAMADLGQNVPNPFNPRTTIPFVLKSGGRTRIRVFDAGGALVRTLVNESLAAGSHEVVWDGRDAHGVTVGSGRYFVQMFAGGEVMTREAMLVK